MWNGGTNSITGHFIRYTVGKLGWTPFSFRTLSVLCCTDSVNVSETLDARSARNTAGEVSKLQPRFVLSSQKLFSDAVAHPRFDMCVFKKAFLYILVTASGYY